MIRKCVFLITLFLLFFACRNQKIEKKTTIVHVYYDITEGLSHDIKLEYEKSLDEIFNFMDLNPKMEYGGSGYGEIHLSFLNYEYFNKPIIFTIKERDESFNTSLYCKNQVKKIIRNVKDTLNYVFNIPITKLDTISEGVPNV